jgi:hypothetical protein
VTPRGCGLRVGARNETATWGRNGDLIANRAVQQHCRQPGRPFATRFSEIAWSVRSRVALPLTVSTWVLGVNRAGNTGDTAPAPLVPAGRRANSPEATRMQ